MSAEKTYPLVAFFPEAFPDGPWGADTIGDSWYVIHKLTGRKKRIGRVIGFKSVSPRRPNYFDRALEEAARRNRALEDAERRNEVVDADV